MLFLYIPCCIGLIAIVLLQKGKSMGFAGAFGLGGGQESIFGPRGGQSMPARLTYAMAALFMLLALGMSLISDKLGKGIAPETVEEAGTIASTEGSGLEDLGLGERASSGPEASEPQPANPGVDETDQPVPEPAPTDEVGDEEELPAPPLPPEDANAP